MTAPCPDWSALVRRRRRAERSPEIGGAAVDRAWEDALRHRGGCARCRAASLRVDPLLLFSGVLFHGDSSGGPRAEGHGGAAAQAAAENAASRNAAPKGAVSRGATSAGTTSEVDELRRRVRLELDGRATEKRLAAARTARRRVPLASVLAAGAAAAAVGLSLLFWPEAAPMAGDLAGAGAAAGEPSLPAHVAMAPLVEPLGDEPMHIFQFPGDDLASSLDIVLVVTEPRP